VVEEELNVDVVESIDREGEVLDYELVPNFKLLGPRLGSRVQQLRSAMGSVDGLAAAADLAAGRPVTVILPDGPLELRGDEVELRVRAQPGFAVSRDGAEVVALDLAVDDDLRRRGLAREVVRHVQELRKAEGLEVSDWIHLHLVGLDDLADMFPLIGREVLAHTVVSSPPEGSGAGTLIELDDGGTARSATIWVLKA
jgi:isoleucyl-tRNA synthetase